MFFPHIMYPLNYPIFLSVCNFGLGHPDHSGSCIWKKGNYKVLRLWNKNPDVFIPIGISAPVGDKVYLYGGEASSEEKGMLHIFESSSKRWIKTRIDGPKLHDASSTSIHTEIYIYGGYGESGLLGSLHQLNTTMVKWKELVGQGDRPMKKEGCGMVHYGQQLFIMGGYGEPSGHVQPGATFIKNTDDPDNRGWSNEFHCFNLKVGKS